MSRFHKFSNGDIVNLDFVATAVHPCRPKDGADKTSPCPADYSADEEVFVLLDVEGRRLAEVPAAEFEKVALEKRNGDMFDPFVRAVRDFCAAVNRMPSSLRVHY